MRRNLENRLARAEIAATAVRWADRQASHHRESLRTGLRFSGLIRERLVALGIDPTLAISLRRDEEAAAELAAIPDTDELRAADEAIVRADYANYVDDGRRQFEAMIERVAVQYRAGHRLDPAKASQIELFAFCMAAEDCDR